MLADIDYTLYAANPLAEKQKELVEKSKSINDVDLSTAKQSFTENSFYLNSSYSSLDTGVFKPTSDSVGSCANINYTNVAGGLSATVTPPDVEKYIPSKILAEQKSTYSAINRENNISDIKKTQIMSNIEGNVNKNKLADNLIKKDFSKESKGFIDSAIDFAKDIITLPIAALDAIVNDVSNLFTTVSGGFDKAKAAVGIKNNFKSSVDSTIKNKYPFKNFI